MKSGTTSVTFPEMKIDLLFRNRFRLVAVREMKSSGVEMKALYDIQGGLPIIRESVRLTGEPSGWKWIYTSKGNHVAIASGEFSARYASDEVFEALVGRSITLPSRGCLLCHVASVYRDFLKYSNLGCVHQSFSTHPLSLF